MPRIKYQGGKAKGKAPGGGMSDFLASHIMNPLGPIKSPMGTFPRPTGKMVWQNSNKRVTNVRYKKRSAKDMPSNRAK